MLIRVSAQEPIPVQLSEAQISDRAMLSVRIAQSLDELHAAFKDVAAEWKKKIKQKEQELKDVRFSVSSGEEFRDVVCERVYDAVKGETWVEFEGKKYHKRPCKRDEIDLLRKKDSMFDDEMQLEDYEDVI